MTIQRETNLQEIKGLLIQLEHWISADTFLKHQNSCIEVEYLFRDLLNLVYGWKLENANALFGANQDSFDLCDKAGGIAVQVTVTTTAKKIRETLRTFIGTHDGDFSRLVFVYPKITPRVSKANFSNDLKGYDFDGTRDRLSLGDILRKAQNMNIEGQFELLTFLRKEIIPGLSTLESVRQNNRDFAAESSIAATGESPEATLICRDGVFSRLILQAIRNAVAQEPEPYRSTALTAMEVLDEENVIFPLRAFEPASFLENEIVKSCSRAVEDVWQRKCAVSERSRCPTLKRTMERAEERFHELLVMPEYGEIRSYFDSDEFARNSINRLRHQYTCKLRDEFDSKTLMHEDEMTLADVVAVHGFWDCCRGTSRIRVDCGHHGRIDARMQELRETGGESR